MLRAFSPLSHHGSTGASPEVTNPSRYPRGFTPRATLCRAVSPSGRRGRRPSQSHLQAGSVRYFFRR